MRNFVQNKFAMPLLLIFASAFSAVADDELRSSVTEKAVGTVVEIKKEEPKKEPAKEEPEDRLNLEILTAPLQLLFGGGVMAAPQAFDPNDANAVAQNDAMVRQFSDQFRPFLTEELGFVRLVCSDLSKEQRPKIKSAGDASLKQAAKQMAQFQNGANRGIANQVRTMPEPRKMIREAVAKALKETLTAEQMERYSREAATRKEDRKLAAILCVVSRLDGSLSLAADQREKIVDSISSHWEDTWEQWLMMNAYPEQYFPEMPEKYVTPFLNADQKSVWNGMQKINFGPWWGGGMGQNPPNDGWWGDEPDRANQANGVGFNFQVRGIGIVEMEEAAVQIVEE